MNYTLARQLDTVRTIATTCILDYIEMHDHPYGIITVTHVEIPKDQRYMDIYLTSTYQPEWLPKFLAPIWPEIRRKTISTISLRAAPTVRFFYDSATVQADAMVSLITRLNTPYETPTADTAENPAVHTVV